MAEISFDNLNELDTRFGPGDSPLSWESASRTDLGRVRHTNEDSLLELHEEQLWVVADGMGGHSRGDYASNAVTQKLQAFRRDPSLAANLETLQSMLLAVNEQCRNAFRDKRPGTTVAALLAHGAYCFYLWAGDSRIYRLRDNSLTLLTKDHSLAQDKHARGELSKEEKKSHASAHVLTRAVGVHRTLKLDLGYVEVEPGDRFLLCSDGLYNPVERAEICALLGEGNPAQACDAMIERALACGGPDNISVVVVESSRTV